MMTTKNAVSISENNRVHHQQKSWLRLSHRVVYFVLLNSTTFM